jgi:hypothetical protein
LNRKRLSPQILHQMDVWLYLPILGHQGIEHQLADTDERTMSYKIQYSHK